MSFEFSEPNYWFNRADKMRARRSDVYSRAETNRQHARDCAEMARAAIDPHLQHTFLELEKLWLERAEKSEERPLSRRLGAIISIIGPK